MELHRVVSLREGAGGKLSGVVIKAVRIAKQDDVNRCVLNNRGKEINLDAVAFVSTRDRRPVAGAQPNLEGITNGVIENLVVDDGYRLGRSSWYAAGEAATGAATVVDSMGTGRAAADAIVHDFEGGEGR